MLKLRTVLAASVIAAVSVPVAAQSATPLGQFRDWGAYVNEADGAKTCFVLSQPKETQPSNVNRGSIYFFVTRRPAQGVNGEVSVVVGYPYRDGSQATVQIGSDSFTLFTRDDGAWMENAAEEQRLVAAMRAGASMTVRGTSQRGTDTVDSYSLSGVTAALDRINSECS